MNTKKVAFIGAGYVGLVNGIGMAKCGAEVWIVENNRDKLNMLKQGQLPIYEEGLDTYLASLTNVHFTDSIKDAINNTDYTFITVGTPMSDTGEADLRAVMAVAKTIGQTMNHNITVVMKSTVPVGTTHTVRDIILGEIVKRQKTFLAGIDDIKDNLEALRCPIMRLDFGIADNPEFLKEGTAITDFNDPDRIVIGTDDNDTLDRMESLYRCLGFSEDKFHECSIRSAELVKYASNSMLAMRISFANMMADFCEHCGADIKEVMAGVGRDNRIGDKFLQAGCGYGGSCFPKDVKALIHQFVDAGCHPGLLHETEDINSAARYHLITKISDIKSASPESDFTIALWGVTFKPKSDDLRESPALYVIENYPEVNFRVYDPLCERNLRKWLDEHPNKSLKDRVRICGSKLETGTNADMVLVLHTSDNYEKVGWMNLHKIMRGDIIYDARNQFCKYQINLMREVGFRYGGYGIQ